MNRLRATWSSGALGKLLIFIAGFAILFVVIGVAGRMLGVFSPGVDDPLEEDLAEPASAEQVSPTPPTPEPSSTPESIPSPTNPESGDTPTPEPKSDEGEFKFGYSEEERKEIYMELVRAEEEATIEAQNLFPTPDPFGGSFSLEAVQAALDSLIRYVQQVRVQIAEMFGLSTGEIDEIAIEGALNGWPSP
jgi:hypothetical protein